MADSIDKAKIALDDIIEKLGRMHSMPLTPETRVLVDVTRDRAKMLKELLAKIEE